MVSKIKTILSGYLNFSNERSRKIAKNVGLSFLIKVFNIVVGLLLLPMTINYVNPVQYGIWLTLSSIIGWMSFFDVGLGNGLRNKLAYSLAFNQNEEAKKYVSTTYATLTLISLALFVLFYFLNQHINWRLILNVPSNVSDDISLVIIMVLGSFCVRFVVQVLNTVLIAIHETSTSSLNLSLGQLGVLIAIFILKRTIPGSLFILVVVLTTVPIVVTFIASIYFYSTRLKYIAPSFASINFSYAKSILNVGGSFFVIQIGAMILFQTDNIIITRVIGPEAVTEFNVAFKLFSVITMVCNIILAPYWSAFTDAYAKEDFAWMKNSMNHIRKLWLGITFIVIPLIVCCSGFIYKFWIGDSIHIPFLLSVVMGAQVIGYTCLMVNCSFLNGIGKIRIQLYLYIFSSIINIPLGVYLGKKMGTSGVTLSNVVVYIFMNIILWIQTNKILVQRDRGLWSK